MLLSKSPLRQRQKYFCICTSVSRRKKGKERSDLYSQWVANSGWWNQVLPGPVIYDWSNKSRYVCVTVFSVKWDRDTTRKFQNSVCVTDVTLFALMIGHKTSLGTLTLLSITLFPHISVVVLSHLFPFCSKSNRSQHYWKKKGMEGRSPYDQLFLAK